MTEIDNLRRINLRDLRPYFEGCKTLKEQWDEHTEGMTLEQRIDFAEKNFHKIEHRLQGTFTFTTTSPFGERKDVLNIEAVIDPLDIDIVGFVLRWEIDGQSKEQHIAIETAPSNLGLNPVRYFVCPFRGRRCRKLYTDWRIFASRYAFPHTYSKRNHSHNERKFYQMFDSMLLLDKIGTHRKETYRGKLTPHGKKMRKMYGYLQDFDLCTIYNHLDRGRGRPRKDG